MSNFPLRWESTGDQWWYASPIDWAAANGHYDLVRELLRIDANHLIQLTSLRRIRRLETVWDDERHSHDVASRRSDVARKLLAECDAKKGRNSLIGSGYGGWLLYTAASAGDLTFVRELLARDPLLVFGEGEYGVTDILYAAARSKDSEVFRVILDFASSPRFSKDQGGDAPSGYKAEIMNRALHAAARGGDLRLLKELIDGLAEDTSAYRDKQGATVLHAASSRGQLEAVEYLTSSFPDMVNSTDDQGNTALHVAAHRGHFPVVEALILASHSSLNATNNAGETFLHSIISGFQTPGFRRLDRQIHLAKRLLTGEKLFEIEKLINLRNNEGRTALHLAISGNVHSDLVELVMSISGIDVNIRDTNCMTPLDILKLRPNSASSEILRKQLIFDSHDHSTRKVILSHMRQTTGNSPGTSFRISDAEIFPYTGMENASDHSDMQNNHSSTRKPNKLKRLLQWPKIKKETTSDSLKKLADETSDRVPVSLRQRFSQLPNNKRTLSVWSNETSPTAKKKHAVGTMQSQKSLSSSISKLSFSSHKGSRIENEMANACC